MCIFCKIVNHEIPNLTIYEDEKVLSFLDISPATKGHCLVIPKKHSDNFLECEDIDAVMLCTQKIANRINDILQPKGMRIQTNIHETAGQSVFHTHIHILPVYQKEDTIGNVMNTTMDELLELQKQLKF